MSETNRTTSRLYSKEERRHAVPLDKLIPLMMAGNCTITAVATDTAETFTFLIKAPKKPADANYRFVSVFTGGDNESEVCYEFIGTFSQNPYGVYFKHSEKSEFSATALSVRWFARLTEILHKKIDTMLLQVWHEGTCARCGRKLTDPESIERGFGSECIKYIKTQT